MTDTQQAARALWAELSINKPGITYADRVYTIAIALTKAEQRGEQSGMERAIPLACEDCAHGSPVEENWDGLSGFYHSSLEEGHWQCKASSLRQQAQRDKEGTCETP
ncbi:MAG: hypothetical protein Q7U76_12740 [Nitrospirota bacterium]|nr:hypothetical protein [Nitrospirota bacterium]